MDSPMDRTCRADILMASMIRKKDHDDVDNGLMVTSIN